MMLKPLFIDNDYQLLNSASGQIARNFWENQDKQLFQPTIVCTPSNFDFKSKWHTIEVKDRYWIWLIGVGLRKMGLPGLAFLPDMKRFSWNLFVRNKIKNVDFDYIHTLSSPQSTHLLGLEIKRHFGKPWIAQFNDPWIDSSGRIKHNPAFTTKIDMKYERYVVENADIIIHTNHILADIWKERYGEVVKDKMFVMPLNFNINPLPAIDFIQKKNEILNIAHIGEIYSTRSSVDFLKGVSILLNKYPRLRNKIHITFVSGIKKEEAEIAKSLGINDVIEITPKLAPEQLIEYYNASDIFLAIDVNLRRSPSYPSKLMMYHYYQKPILGITNPNSIMEEELMNSGNKVCYYGKPEQIADYLYIACTDYQSLCTFNNEYWKKFTIDHVSKKYNSFLTKLKLT